MNILDTEKQIRPCTSCQVCGAVCPSSAIHFELNEDGFYRPLVDKTLCVDCSLCTLSCPKYDDNIQVTSNEELENILLYAASAKDDKVEQQTTSGGIADLLAHELIDTGYKVVGVIYDKADNNAKHKIATSYEDTLLFRGSKYIQPYSLEAFRSVLNGCAHEKYAVFGLPCQIYGLSRFLDRIHKRNQCFLIDLFCHGCPSMLVWNKISDEIRINRRVDSFDNVIWRSKLKGWGKFILEVQKDGKRIYNSQPLHNEFFDLFFCNQVLNESCSTCKLRGTLKYTDIRLGDFWGPVYRKSLRGMSGVSVVTPKAKELTKRIKGHINIKEMQWQTFFPYQSWNHEYKVDELLRQRIISELRNPNKKAKDVLDLIPSHHTTRYLIKTYIKQLLFYLPRKVINLF